MKTTILHLANTLPLHLKGRTQRGEFPCQLYTALSKLEEFFLDYKEPYVFLILFHGSFILHTHTENPLCAQQEWGVERDKERKET